MLVGAGEVKPYAPLSIGGKARFFAFKPTVLPGVYADGNEGNPKEEPCIALEGTVTPVPAPPMPDAPRVELVAPAPLAGAGDARFAAEPPKPAPPAAPKPIRTPLPRLPVAKAPKPPVIIPACRAVNPTPAGPNAKPAIIGSRFLRLKASGNPVLGLMVMVVPLFRARDCNPLTSCGDICTSMESP